VDALNSEQLARIPQELKEGVCNALVNLTVARVTGSDRDGQVIYGRSPRRSIVSGQLLPRFDVSGSDDETSDIRIAAIGIDFQTAAGARGEATATPSFSVYVRVFPTWTELTDEALGLEIDFKLRQPIKDAIDARIRQLRNEGFAAANVATPDWPNLNPAQRQQIRVRRAAIQEEVRRLAYREQGIILEQGDEQFLADQAEGEAVAEQGAANAVIAPPPPDNNDAADARMRLGVLLRRGRAVPFGHLESAPPPPVWRRIDLTFPPLAWSLDVESEALRALLADYTRDIQQHLIRQVTAWINSDEGLRHVWRDVRVQPQDAASEQSWNAFLERARQVAPSLRHLLPAVAGVTLQIERNVDFSDPTRVANRVLLDNASPELSRRESATRSDTIFCTGINVSIPRDAHRSLRLDRVEPSYRFRHFLDYPAIGLNCGVVERSDERTTHLATTWSPRFVQPRVVPRDPRTSVKFADLCSPAHDANELLSIPDDYERWVEGEEARLRVAVREGLSPSEADVETQRLEQDLRDQRREIAYIERGIRLLINSSEAYRSLPHGLVERACCPRAQGSAVSGVAPYEPKLLAARPRGPRSWLALVPARLHSGARSYVCVAHAGVS
jgi:hypothetical protein